MSKRRLHLDDHAIDVLTPDVCWAVGWIASDGCIYAGRNVSVTVSVRETDIDVLEKLRNIFKYAGDFYWRAPGGGYDSQFAMVTLQLRSPTIANRLIDLGIGPRKSGKHGFPNEILEAGPVCIGAFIRGYFEGNGSAGVKTDGWKPAISFCGPHGFLIQLVKQLRIHCGVRENTVRKHSQSQVVSEVAYKCRPAIKILDWLYSGCLGPCSKRKLDRFFKIKESCAERFTKDKWMGEAIDGLRPVQQFSKIGGHMKTWPSIAAAAKGMKTKTEMIKRVADGKRQTACGFRWYYAS